MATLSEVRFYTPQDVYYYESDNRPLQDLNGNIQAMAEQADGLWGYVQAIPLQDTGTVDNLVVYTNAFQSSGEVLDGQLLGVVPAFSCTGATTLTLNNFPSGNVLSNGNQLIGGELVAGNPSLLAYQALTGDWLLFSGNTGSFQTNPSTVASELVTYDQLGAGTLSGGFNVVEAVSTTVSGSASFGGNVSAAAATGGGELVNLWQINDGLSQQASLINWAGVTADAPLPVGSTAYYEVSTATGNIPLYIACGDMQIYEVTYINLVFAATSQGLKLSFLPNNSTYSGQFSQTAVESCYTNQAQFYNPPSTTQEYGFSVVQNVVTDSFWYDEVDGIGTPPFIRTITIWTGVTSTTPIQPPMTMCWGGGGVTYNLSTGYIPGVDLQQSGWTGNTGTPWTSLGTFSEAVASGTSNQVLILVKRLA